MEEWINRAWTGLLTAAPVLVGAWLWFRGQLKEAQDARIAAEANERRAIAEARRTEVQVHGEEVKVIDAEATAEQKRKQEHSDWAVRQAMQLYAEMKSQVVIALYKVEKAVKAETRCRVLVATLYTQVREMQKKLKIDRTDPDIDRWVDQVLNPQEDGQLDSDDPTAAGDANG